MNQLKARHLKLGIAILSPLLVGLGGCVCCPQKMFTGCVDFESLTSGTRYEFQDTFVDADVLVTVESFQWGNGNWTEGNYAQVDDRQRSGGTGLDVQTNNVNLRFDFGILGLNGLTVDFGEYGGNVNMQINGEFTNFQNMSMLDGTSLGGAAISVTGGTGNDTGSIDVNGKVQSFAMGGQELWIDNVCSR